MRIWLGPRLLVVVTDPDQLQVLMQSPKMSTKSFVYRFLEPFMGLGLFTSSGTQHKTQRKLLQPLFGSKYLEGYSYLFQKHANNLIQRLELLTNKKEFDILTVLHESAFEATMDILIEDKNDHSIDYSIFPQYVRRFYHIFSKRVVSFWQYPDILFKMTNHYKEQQNMVNIVKTMTEEVKTERMPDIIKRIENRFDDINANKKERIPSILDMMVEIVMDSPGCLDEAEFIDHLMTFVATSQDTQSSAIAFTLMMLGMHQHYQDKVYNELREVRGTAENLKYDDLAKLVFMEMCLKEAMRLFPLGPFLPRDAVEDFQLGKWMLPAGCTVILGVYQVHRNSKLWEKPDEFYPEHFLPEAVANRHPYAYLPFSGGPRRCVAQHYSYVNMKIILGTILQHFIISCPYMLKDMELVTDVSIRPKGGYQISLTKRS